MGSHLKQFMQEMLPAVEEEMRAVLRADGGAAADPFLGMMHYHMGWVDENLKEANGNGGKRIRPLLCLLSCAASGGQWQQAVPAGAAVEILHNFTLIHDDIEDASPTRRGRLTVWKLWGIPQAINSGDCMFALAHTAMYCLGDREVPAEIVVRAAQRFDETCLTLTEGQYYDMSFETREGVTVEQYLHMIGGKTAALLGLCGELGALIAGAGTEEVEHFATFSRDLGMAFQVKDDILGIWGDEEAIGKSSATDIATRKKTLPVLFGLQESSELRRLYAQPENGPGFVKHVIELLDASGARTYALQKASEYSDSALRHLEAAQPQEPAATALRELASLLLERDH